MVDRWRSLPIQCVGGLVLNLDALSQGTNAPGSAVILQNYEPALEGGYKRILGYSKYDDNTVTGDASAPVLGVKVGLGGVVACRKNGTSYDLLFSVGSGWTKINTANRTGVVTKMRGIDSAIAGEAVILLDGANPALKYNGSTDTLISGTGAPADPKYGAIYKNRVVLAGYSSDPSELSISEPNSDTGFNGANGAATIPCSDVIVGLKTFRDNLYIFCQNSIKELTGTTSSNFQLNDVTTSIGCVSGDTIQELGGDLVFLAPDGVRSLGATARIGDISFGLVSQQIQPFIRGNSFTSLNDGELSSVVIRAKSQYRVYANTAASAENSVGIVGKFEPRASDIANVGYVWGTLAGVKPYCADSSYESNRELSVIGHPTNGYVHKLESGNSFDGTAISYRYRSPDLTFSDATIRKVYQKIETYTEVEGDFQVSVRLILDRGVTNIPQPNPTVLSQIGATPTYGSAVYNTSTYGQLQYPTFKTNLVGSSFTAAFEYYGSDTHPPHRIDAFQIIFAAKGFR